MDKLNPLRSILLFTCILSLGWTICFSAQAQLAPIQQSLAPLSAKAVVPATKSIQTAGGQAVSNNLPDMPVPSSTGRIYGTVTDSADNVVMGAHVTLIFDNTKEQRTLITGSSGFFDFTGLGPGKYRATITSAGFAGWTTSELVLMPGQYYEIPHIQLRIAAANTSVRVVFSRHDLAEKQMHVEEKQRILGVVPNFYTSYVWDAEPLTSGQKFRLAWKLSIDPMTFLGTGAVAGIQQWQNDFSGYGQGSQGYAKRFGASYADTFSGIMIGGAILPSLLHQDPRYFYKGTGSITSRALYAISTVVICKGDNGRWQPNYSNVLGNLAAAGISNIYYPSTDRGTITIDNALIGTASGAIGSLLQEFLIRKISRGVPHSPSLQP